MGLSLSAPNSPRQPPSASSRELNPMQTSSSLGNSRTRSFSEPINPQSRPDENDLSPFAFPSVPSFPPTPKSELSPLNSPGALEQQPSGPPPRDHGRISQLLQNTEEVMGHFVSLEASLRGGKRLKDVLYQTEQDHGFAEPVHRIDGLLDSGEFMGMVKAGLMFKDRGAARDHGENSHRLQWYAVAKDMEANPDRYNTTKASDLYKDLAGPYEQGQEGEFKWDTLFDHTQQDFRQAETLHAHLQMQTTLPLLQKAARAEQQKRTVLDLADASRLRKGEPERGQKLDRKIQNWESRRETVIQKVLSQNTFEEFKGEVNKLTALDNNLATARQLTNNPPRERKPHEQPKTSSEDFERITPKPRNTGNKE
jgi:hypothetical protein